MGELINLIIEFQRYFAVLLFAATAFLWYSIRGRDRIFYSTNTYIPSLIFGMSFPFFVKAINFIPGWLNLGIRSVLFFVLSALLFVFSLISYKEKREERVGYLREIIDKKKDLPLKLEFVREIINPELKLIQKEKRSLEKAKGNLKAEEQEIEKKRGNVDKRKKEQELETLDLKKEFFRNSLPISTK